MASPTCLFEFARRQMADLLDDSMRRHGGAWTDTVVEAALVTLRDHLVARHGRGAAYARLAQHADLAAAPIHPEPANRGE